MTKSKKPDHSALINTWKTGHLVTLKFIAGLPEAFWNASVPGYKRKTIAMICGHLHNARCYWINETGKSFGVASPPKVNRYKVSRDELKEALNQSSDCIITIVKEAERRGQKVNKFPDLVHFITYLTSHEAHHRGQILMAARQLNYELGNDMTYGIWHWNKIAKEASDDS